MKNLYKIVIDTNVLVSAVNSNKGASFKLLSLIDSGKFIINISVALILEYEAILKRESLNLPLSEDEVDAIINYICFIGKEQKIFFLWRPYLKDPKDDMLLELAVESHSEYIITYNKKDFKSIEKFGIEALAPKEFLKLIGEVK